ncbi:hypothetical protein Tco_0613814 [Tanacetum coccineum]
MNIESMTIVEYNLYVAKHRLEKNPLNNHSYGFTPQFFTQPPNTPVDKNDFDFDEILDDLFRIGAGNLKRMGHDKLQNRCDDDTSIDRNHESGNHLKFPIFSATNKFSSIYEQDVDLEEDQEEDGDDGDIFDIWSITVEDVERIRQFLAPNVPDEIDEVIKPLILQPIHTTPPTDDYVAPATKSMLSPFNIMSRKAYNSIMKHQLVYTGNNMAGFAKNLYVFVGGHQFLIDFIILEDINEFVEKG